MITLLRTLIHLSLVVPNADSIARVKQQMNSTTKSEWEKTIAELKLHRLLPITFYSLKKYNLTEDIPNVYFLQMQAAYLQTQKSNTFFRLALENLLQSLEKQNLYPVLWKGIVLADSFYPNLGTRPMGDLDFAIQSHEIEPVTKVFQSLKYSLQDEMETEDAVYFLNSMGVLCDVHHRVRLFEGKESMNLTMDLKPQQINLPAIKVLEPNAMLVHLIVHLNGHAPETGITLFWILDILFVLRKWGELIDLERLEKLMPTKKDFVCLFRIIRFLETEFKEEFPTCLSSAAKHFDPFTLEEILRQRRLALWGLPRLRGWLRFGAIQLGFKLANFRPNLDVSDLFFWSADYLRNYRNIGRKNSNWCS